MRRQWFAFIPAPLHSGSPYPRPDGQGKVVLDAHIHLPVIMKSDGIPFVDPHLYRSIVGGLQYLSFTRPDVAFAVHMLANICIIRLNHIG